MKIQETAQISIDLIDNIIDKWRDNIFRKFDDNDQLIYAPIPNEINPKSKGS